MSREWACISAFSCIAMKAMQASSRYALPAKGQDLYLSPKDQKDVLLAMVTLEADQRGGQSLSTRGPLGVCWFQEAWPT